MGRIGFLLVPVSAMLLIIAWPPAVRSQEVISGVLSAMSFQPVPENLPILVRPLDDSPQNLAIKGYLEQALSNAGFAVAKQSSSVVLSFETRRELGGGSTPRRQVTDRFIERHEQSDFGDQRYKPQIGKSSPQGPRGISASRFRLDATLDDRQSGKRLWRGWAIAPMQGDETNNLARAMAPVLAGSLGETVREETFEVPVGTTHESQIR